MGLAVTGLGDITVGTAVSQWVQKNRGFALGIVYTGSNLGGALLTRVATAIATQTDWRTALFWIGAVGSLAILPFAAFVVKTNRATRDSAASEPPSADASARDDASGDLQSNLDDSLDARAALRTRSFWVAGIRTAHLLLLFPWHDRASVLVPDRCRSRSRRSGRVLQQCDLRRHRKQARRGLGWRTGSSGDPAWCSISRCSHSVRSSCSCCPIQTGSGYS